MYYINNFLSDYRFSKIKVINSKMHPKVSKNLNNSNNEKSSGPTIQVANVENKIKMKFKLNMVCSFHWGVFGTGSLPKWCVHSIQYI